MKEMTGFGTTEEEFEALPIAVRRKVCWDALYQVEQWSIPGLLLVVAAALQARWERLESAFVVELSRRWDCATAPSTKYFGLALPTTHKFFFSMINYFVIVPGRGAGNPS